MSSNTLIVIIVAAAVVVLALTLTFAMLVRRRHLRDRFGPEYERTVDHAGTLDHYRSAHDVKMRCTDGRATTE